MIINGESKAQRSGSQQAADSATSDGRQLGRSLLSSVVEWFGRYEIETFEIVLYELTALSRESSSGRGRASNLPCIWPLSRHIRAVQRNDEISSGAEW